MQRCKPEGNEFNFIRSKDWSPTIQDVGQIAQKAGQLSRGEGYLMAKSSITIDSAPPGQRHLMANLYWLEPDKFDS